MNLISSSAEEVMRLFIQILLMIYVQALAVVDLTVSPSVVYQLQTPTLSGHGERSLRVTYLSYQWL